MRRIPKSRIGSAQQPDKWEFIEFPVIANQSADWCGNPPDRRMRYQRGTRQGGRKSSKCNTFLGKNLSRSFPIETFSRAVIDKVFDKLNILIGNRPEIKAFWKEKSHNVVRIFVCSALPWFMRLGKVDKSR